MSKKDGGDQIRYKPLGSVDLTSFAREVELVGDLQDFKRLVNESVLNEFPIIEVNKNCVADNSDNNATFTFHFEAPCHWNILPAEYKNTNSWLQRNYHGIPWNSGNIPYKAAGPTIRGILQKAHTIIFKGLEKKSGLRV